MRVQLDSALCDRIARTLIDLGLPEPVEPWGLMAQDVAYDLATLNLAMVAVCHQTQRLVGEVNGRNLRGWDYLQSRFQSWAAEDKSRVEAGRLAAFTSTDLKAVLNCCDQQLSDADLAERAILVSDCGATLGRQGLHSLSDLYDHCGAIGADVFDLLSALREFRAFKDPVQKKSLYLLGLNGSTCGWKYRNPQMLDPPVDYHEVRGHLRLGTVRIVDDALREAVTKGNPVDETADVEIRTAVTQAIRRISESSGFAPMQLHYAFWNLFRGICLRQRPVCVGALQGRLPASYSHLVKGDSCCFTGYCSSANSANAVDEHRFATNWY
jgi:hypothetical protein